jgi:hypothetical protein
MTGLDGPGQLEKIGPQAGRAGIFRLGSMGQA